MPHSGLPCGQGLEACTLRAQREVPVIVGAAAEAECLAMSLVATCASCRHRAVNRRQDIQAQDII